MRKYLIYLVLIGGIIGIFDAGYLTIKQYENHLPPCSTNVVFADCGKVLNSSYSKMFGIPLALIGLIHYSLITILVLLQVLYKKEITKKLLLLLTIIGFISSVYFVFLQLFVISAICFYCMVSAINSTLLFLIAQVIFKHQISELLISVFAYFYKFIVKPILFSINPEIVHISITTLGELLGRLTVVKIIIGFYLKPNNPQLVQQIGGLKFVNPIGLSAGFDYEARLTQILPQIGFGFGTIGTITNLPYDGNPRPMLGRLPKSKSLMVNKGFKNPGAVEIIHKLEKLSFDFPLGISIGRTNRKDPVTFLHSLKDIRESFLKFEQSKIKHAYYELNISCPNLYGNVNFYEVKKLHQLLNSIDRINLSRPLFIKMPIEKSNREILAMLRVINKHRVTGVIFGNLQKDRNHPSLNPIEVSKFPVGNFSGKPTFDRSNELIALTYKHFKNRLLIIGCGGVFSAEDAYTKIKLGATLVQLITGMIFQGPQLIADINQKLPKLLSKDKFKHISEAIGSDNENNLK